MIKKILFSSLLIILAASINFSEAQKVRAILKPDEGAVSKTLVTTMEQNLSTVLSEINSAYNDGRQPFLKALAIDRLAEETIEKIWEQTPFFCDSEVFRSRLWNFKNSYMAREVPVQLKSPDPEYGAALFQWAVVDFDKNGRIADFRFSPFSSGESLAMGGDIVEAERQMIIRQYCERLRTAYNTKDTVFLNQVFSEDALIITGREIRTRNSDMKPISKIQYTKQTKAEYLKRLQRCFENNRWIHVKFEAIVDDDGDTALTITQSVVNPNFYGVRLRQEWVSSSGYHDEGYVFLLFDFTVEEEPVIHVRTWQPEFLGGRKLKNEEILGLDAYGY